MTNNKPAGDSSPHSYMATPARPARISGQGPAARRHARCRARGRPAHARLLPEPQPRRARPRRAEQGHGHVPVRPAGASRPRPREDIAEHAEYVLSREQIGAAMLIGYGPEELVAAGPRQTAAPASAAAWTCRKYCGPTQAATGPCCATTLGCCPPEGRSYDPGSHPAAAAMTEAGRRPNRIGSPWRGPFSARPGPPTPSRVRPSRPGCVSPGSSTSARPRATAIRSCEPLGSGAWRYSRRSAATAQAAASTASRTSPGWPCCSATSGFGTTPGRG